jgi:hypothetical protein
LVEEGPVKDFKVKDHPSGLGYPAGSQLRLRSTCDTCRLSEVETGCTGCLFLWKSLNDLYFPRESLPQPCQFLF